MPELVLISIYIVGVIVASAVIGFFDPPKDSEAQIGTALCALMWPVILPFFVVGGILWCIGWVARWAGGYR